MKIRLDAEQDLYEAGEENDDDSVAQFEAAYKAAAEREAAERGIEIEIITPGDPDYLHGSSTDEENEIWQAIHERLHLIDGEWM